MSRHELLGEFIGWAIAVLMVVMVYTMAIFAYSITESMLEDSRKGDAGKLPEPHSQ